MVLEKLGGSLRDALRKIAGASHVDEKLVKEVVRDIQRALLQADVRVDLVLKLSRALERRALQEKPPPGMSAREHVIRIIYEELVGILGGTKEVKLGRQRILLVGLYGNGKTTTAAKLARWFQKKGLRVALIAADTHRPAAFDQLRQLADQIGVPIHGEPGVSDAPGIARRGIRHFENMDVVIVDTSGRHSLEPDLIQEIEEVAAAVGADESILVLDAATGQQAGPQAKAFHEAVGVTSVIVTKLDGSAKGGGALSAVAETKAPISFVGTGEKIEDLETFDPPRFISRLLGMGDLQSLLEKAQEALAGQDVEETARRMLSGKFSLRDMYDQMDALTRMGPLSKVFSLLPGAPGKMSEEQLEATQAKLKRYRVIMDSMTEEELENPRLVKSSRVLRVAHGSGTEPREVKELIRQYNASRRALRGLVGNRKIRRQLMKQMKAGGLDIGELAKE